MVFGWLLPWRLLLVLVVVGWLHVSVHFMGPVFFLKLLCSDLQFRFRNLAMAIDTPVDLEI